MRIWAALGLISAILFVAMFSLLIGSSGRDMMTIVATIVFGYAALLDFAVLFVRRWAKRMSA